MVDVQYKGGFFLVTTDNIHELSNLNSLMDGKKVRGAKIIKVHKRAISKLIEHGIDYNADEETEKKISSMYGAKLIRERNIDKIKNMYYEDEIQKYDYDYKGPYKDLMKHQKILYLAAVHNTSAALLGEPGTGKTLSFLAAIDKLKQLGKVNKVLIITLATLKENVLEEMNKQVPHLTGVVLKGGKSRADKILNKKFKIAKKNIDYDVYISNYESMRGLVDVFSDDYFDMVILDEAHRISGISKQTKAIIKKFENTKRKYISTGTLVSNNLLSFFNPFRFMGHDTVPYANYYGFRAAYMRAVDDDGRIWVPRKGALKAVEEIIGKNAILFTKNECLDLPELTFQNIHCELSKEQKEFYDKLKTELVMEMEEVCPNCSKYETCTSKCTNELFVKNALVLTQKLQQVAAGFYMDNKFDIDEDGKETKITNIIKFKNVPKLDLLVETISTIPKDKKVIIWSHSVVAIEMILEKLGKNGVISCYGSDDTFKKVNEFREGDYKIMVANPFKMGVGQNMQFSTYQIFYTNSFSYVIRDQAICRQYRAGQDNKVTVIDLTVKDTVDEHVLKSLSNKEDLSISLTTLARVGK